MISMIRIVPLLCESCHHEKKKEKYGWEDALLVVVVRMGASYDFYKTLSSSFFFFFFNFPSPQKKKKQKKTKNKNGEGHPQKRIDIAFSVDAHP